MRIAHAEADESTVAMVAGKYPVLPEFQGIPQEYQSGAEWVPDAAYQGGGYYADETGQHYDYAQLEKLWTDAGGPASAAPQMAYIAEYDESGGYAGAWNSSGATGLWQIEYPSSYSGNRQDLFTPLVNAEAAVQLYDSSGFAPWQGDKYENLDIPAAQSVPGEDTAVPGGSTTYGSPATETSATSGSTLGSLLGISDWQDLAERLGLIILGGLLLLLGIYMMANKQVIQIASKVK